MERFADGITIGGLNGATTAAVDADGNGRFDGTLRIGGLLDLSGGIEAGHDATPFFAAKSTENVTGLTTATIAHDVTTNDVLTSSKISATGGGVALLGMAEDNSQEQVFTIEAYGGAGQTTKSTAGIGLINFTAAEHDGANALANIAANGNVLSIRAQTGGAMTTKFIVDEDGDYHYDGADGGAFDAYEDAQLVRAFSVATSDPKTVARSKFDELVHYNEDSLVEAGILGDTVENGGLVNGAQLQRLLCGAVWQAHETICDLTERLSVAERKLALLEA